MNSRFIVNVEQGLKEAGFEVTTENWLNRFDETVCQSQEAYYGKMRQKLAENGPAVFMEILTNPFHAPETIPVLDEDIQESDAEYMGGELFGLSGGGRFQLP